MRSHRSDALRRDRTAKSPEIRFLLDCADNPDQIFDILIAQRYRGKSAKFAFDLVK